MYNKSLIANKISNIAIKLYLTVLIVLSSYITIVK